MKNITLFLVVIVIAINGYGQSIDKFIGEFAVTDISTVLSGGGAGYKDTASYIINIVSNNDNKVSILNFAQLDTVKASIKSDSIDIFSQTLKLDDGDLNIKGAGKLYTDTIKYQYTSGSARGVIECKCIAIRLKKNSINEFERNASLLKCYPNPFSNSIVVDIEIPNNVVSAVLRIYDINGIVVSSVNLSNREKFSQIIDSNRLDNGVYYCVFYFDTKTKYYSKIIKQK